MRYGVATEELASVAAVVRADAARAASTVPALRAAADTVGAWTVGRASTAARALFDTLADAASEAEAGLLRVADQVAAAAGEYEGTETRLLRPR